MLVTKEIQIDMGHRVSNHKSKCRNLHGHRYVVECGVDDKIIESKSSSDEGMVIDFGDLKQIMMEEIDANFDHGFVIYEKDPYHKQFEIWARIDLLKVITVPFIPTAENLARFWFGLLQLKLKEKGIKINHVKVWETPTSSATYKEIKSKKNE